MIQNHRDGHRSRSQFFFFGTCAIFLLFAWLMHGLKRMSGKLHVACKVEASLSARDGLKCYGCCQRKSRDSFTRSEMNRSRRQCIHCIESSPKPRRPFRPLPRTARLSASGELLRPGNFCSDSEIVSLSLEAQATGGMVSPFGDASFDSASASDVSGSRPSGSSLDTSSVTDTEWSDPPSSSDSQDGTWDVDIPAPTAAAAASASPSVFVPDADIVNGLHRALWVQSTTGDAAAGVDIAALLERLDEDIAFSNSTIAPGTVLCTHPIRIVARTQARQVNVTRPLVFNFFRRLYGDDTEAQVEAGSNAARCFWELTHPRAMELSLPANPNIKTVPGRIALSPVQRAAVWQRHYGSNVQSGPCIQCGAKMDFNGNWTAGHKIAAAVGGNSGGPDDYAPVCLSCNASMGTTPAPISWYSSRV